MSDNQQLAEYNADVLDSQPALRQAFMMMLVEVPEPSDDAAASIVGAILAAEDVDDLDKPWDSEGMRPLAGRVIVVNEITRRPSDYADGLGVYLGCDCTLEATGEKLFVTTGSVSIVAQLVRAFTLGKLPLKVIPTEAKKPSANGYLPMHLEIVREGKR